MKKTIAIVGAITGSAVAAIIVKKVMDKRNTSKMIDALQQEMSRTIDTHTEVDAKLGKADITTYGNGMIRLDLYQNTSAAIALDNASMEMVNKCLRIASDLQAKHSPNYGLELNNIPSALKSMDFPGIHGSLPGGYELTMHSHLLLAAVTVADIYRMKAGKHDGKRTIVLQRSITGMYKIAAMPMTEAERIEKEAN